MELSDRKKKILRAIVDLYIRTAEPVASKTIAQMPDMDFSSATIRNEMAELTTLGYLEQPHTSAGRIPSPAGYRLYVDEVRSLWLTTRGPRCLPACRGGGWRSAWWHGGRQGWSRARGMRCGCWVLAFSLFLILKKKAAEISMPHGLRVSTASIMLCLYSFCLI